MLRFIRTILISGMLFYVIFYNIDSVHPVLVAGIIVMWFLIIIENLRDGGWESIKQSYEWLIKLLARPVVNHYETREKNYKDLIFKLESQLYQKRVELGEEEEIHPSGTSWGLSQELNNFFAEETQK